MNYNILDLPSIKAELKFQLDEITAVTTAMQEASFFDRIPGKWNVADNVEHLITTNNITLLGFLTPKPILNLFFKSTLAPRDAKTLVGQYLTAVGGGAGSPVLYLPKPLPGKTKSLLLNIWKSSADRLLKTVGQMKEEDLDSLYLPHPILGQLSLREMLFFTVYHNYHHLNTIKALGLYAAIA